MRGVTACPAGICLTTEHLDVVSPAPLGGRQTRKVSARGRLGGGGPTPGLQDPGRREDCASPSSLVEGSSRAVSRPTTADVTVPVRADHHCAPTAIDSAHPPFPGRRPIEIVRCRRARRGEVDLESLDPAVIEMLELLGYI